MANERRKHERKPWNSTISYQICDGGLAEKDKISLRGETIDISAGGLCITTDRMLSPGLVIAFGETRLTGIVRWGTQSNVSFSAGIQLI
jgi:hypothetical protein